MHSEINKACQNYVFIHSVNAPNILSSCLMAHLSLPVKHGWNKKYET